MLRINPEEAKTRLPALLALVEEQGETILICRDGHPVAELRAALGSIVPIDPLT